MSAGLAEVKPISDAELDAMLAPFPKVVFLLAWDSPLDDPNPHAFDLDTVEYETFEAAWEVAEREAADEDSPNFSGRWVVVASVAS